VTEFLRFYLFNWKLDDSYGKTSYPGIGNLYFTVNIVKTERIERPDPNIASSRGNYHSYVMDASPAPVVTGSLVYYSYG
jgi:hypothetical protein